jgi:CRP-like cAMP-binding protein
MGSLALMRNAADARTTLSAAFERCLRQQALSRHLARNEVLFTRGSVPDALYCVNRGRIRLSSAGAAGKEVVLSLMEPGHWFGEVSLVTGAATIYDARAADDTEVLVVPAGAFHGIVDGQPQFLQEFMRLVCARYRWALAWIDESILLPFSIRLARRLLAAHDSHGQSAAGAAAGPAVGPEAGLRLSQEDLSNMLGVSRQSVNRQLKEWEASRLLRLDYGRVTLLNKAGLESVARDGVRQGNRSAGVEP